MLRTVPAYAAWLDVMDPITDVFPMGGLHNTLRRLVVDGTPVATGLLAIGDSVCTTNPTLGRGLALALTGAADLADTLGEHGGDRAGQALALDRLVAAHVAPFYQDQAAIDAARLAMMRHTIFGEPVAAAARGRGPGELPAAARGRMLRPGRLPRVLEDQRHGLPARAGLHRPARGRVHAGSAQQVRQRPSGGPAHPRAAARRPRGLNMPAEPLDTASAPAHDRTVIVKPNRDRRTERHEAIRQEILDAAWDAAHETSIAGLTLRDIASRVGMQQPSLYSHFASKQAIYDAMFKQAWQAYLDDARNAVDGLPAAPRARLIAMAEHYFDFAVADLPRHQLMDVNVVPNFQPSPEAYAPAMEVYHQMLEQLRGIGITRDEDADIYTALLGGLVNQQLANDPGGQRWRRLIPRVISMFADDLGLP